MLIPGRRAWAAVLSAVLCLGACGPKKRVARIALAVPLTGDLGTEGQGLRRAALLAVEEAAAAGRLPFPVELVAFDDRGDPREAVHVANLIISDPDIVGVIGPYNSHCALAAAKVYGSASMPMITPAATHPDVTRQQLKSDWKAPRVVFRVVPTDDLQGPKAAEFVRRRLGLRTVFIVHDSTPYGQGLTGQFARAFLGLGGKVVAEQGLVSGEKDYGAIVARIKEAAPDAVYFGGLYIEAGLLLKQMREAGAETAFVSGDASKTPSLFDVAGPAADGAYLSMVGVPVELLPAAKGFVSRYKKRWPGRGEELKPFDHYGYEAVRILLEALAKAGPDRAKVLAGLRLSRYEGLLGTTAFDAKGDTLNTVITLTRAHYADRAFPVMASRRAVAKD